MKNKGKILLIFTITIFICGLFLGADGRITWAAEEAIFGIDAQVLPTDKPTYDIQVTIENLGADWEGTARLKVYERYGRGYNCAYDTALSLPQGSTKQFVVRLPKGIVDRTDGTVQITLLDKKQRKSAEKGFKRLLQDSMDALPMGILSDEYASLTYLDMGGREIYYGDRNRPIKLVQLEQGRLTGTLDTLIYLIIDSYDTTALTDEEVESIERWVDNGGILLVGTGSYAQKTLGGLDFLSIQYSEVKEAEMGEFDWKYYVDVSQLSLVELKDADDTFDQQSRNNLSLTGSRGDGAVSVLPCALSQLGRLGADAYNDDSDVAQETLVEMLLDNAAYLVDSHYQSNQTSDYMNYNLQRILPALGKGASRLQIGGLKILIILYVIFVGPLLYLILRAFKGRDLYWIAVPVAALAGILLVYWAGRGFEVAKTNVYSVTVENLSKKGSTVTYLRCYDAGHKEWSLQMAQGYAYAGPLLGGYIYSGVDDGYYHRIQKEGDRLLIGIDPTGGFEDGYFMAGAEKEPKEGTISWDGNQTISNETQYDFAYFAVIMNNDLMIYKNLAAGERFNLEENAGEYIDTVAGSYYYSSGNYTPAENYFYGYLRDALRSDDKDIDLIAALGMGVASASFQVEPGQVLIVGLIQDWEKTIDDNCSEVSYGCLYVTLEDKNAIHQ